MIPCLYQISSSSCLVGTQVHMVEDNMVLDSMVVAHSNEDVVGMDRSKNRDRSSSLTKKEQMLP